MPGIEQVVHTYIAAWNENDPQARQLLLEQCAAEDIIIIIEHRQLKGRHEVFQSIEQFRQDRPDDRGVLTSEIEIVQNWFRFTAEVIRPDGTSYSKLLDVGEAGPDGRIVRVVTFIGSLPPTLNS